MMKGVQITILSFILVCLLFSCESKEEYLNNLSVQQNTSSIDSSAFEHNVSYNNHYFQLVFDTAYAVIGPTYGRDSEGCGPATIVFVSEFHDKYKLTPFRLIINSGYSIHGDTNFRYYVTEEVQDRLDDVPQFFECQKYQSSCGWMGYGTSLVNGENYKWIIPQKYLNPTIDPQTITGEIELISYHTYMIGLDKYADFHFVFDGTVAKVDLRGKLKAQFQ